MPAAWALPAAALPIIWVAVGGRKDLTATLIGTLLVLWLFQKLTHPRSQYALIVIGACCWSSVHAGDCVVWLSSPRGSSLTLARRGIDAAARRRPA